jgi:hypothetical protein
VTAKGYSLVRTPCMRNRLSEARGDPQSAGQSTDGGDGCAIRAKARLRAPFFSGHATPDRAMGVPPPATLSGHAFCGGVLAAAAGAIVPVVRRLRMGSFLPGCCGAESQGRRCWRCLPIRVCRAGRRSSSRRPTCSPSQSMRLTPASARAARATLRPIYGRSTLYMSDVNLRQL